jgi:hypothetical protein
MIKPQIHRKHSINHTDTSLDVIFSNYIQEGLKC